MKQATPEEKDRKFLGFSGPIEVYSDSNLLVKNQKQLTPAEEEAYVRARWADCAFGITIYCSVAGLPSAWHGFDSWHAAFLFTKQRESEIADVEEEIGFLGGPYCLECPSVERILAREQAALAELRRGWKGEARKSNFTGKLGGYKLVKEVEG